jgi:hypothetical protein
MVLAVVAVSGLLAACSSDDETLDVAATEDAVADVVVARLGPEVDEVRCPEEIERAAGAVIECRAVLADERGEVRLRVRQADGDGALDVEELDAVIDRDAVATDLRGRLTDTHERDFLVDCADRGDGDDRDDVDDGDGDGDDGDGRVEVVAPGSVITCEATDEFGDREVTVTVIDPAGTLRYQVGDEPGTDDETDDGEADDEPSPDEDGD